MNHAIEISNFTHTKHSPRYNKFKSVNRQGRENEIFPRTPSQFKNLSLLFAERILTIGFVAGIKKKKNSLAILEKKNIRLLEIDFRKSGRKARKGDEVRRRDERTRIEVGRVGEEAF